MVVMYIKKTHLTYSPCFIQRQDGDLFPSAVIQDLWMYPMVQTATADQDFFYVQLPKIFLFKKKFKNHLFFLFTSTAARMTSVSKSASRFISP